MNFEELEFDELTFEVSSIFYESKCDRALW